jgi:hypothetical protein
MHSSTPLRRVAVTLSVLGAVVLALSTQGPEGEALAKPVAKKSAAAADAGAPRAAAAAAPAAKPVPGVPDPEVKVKSRPGGPDCGFFFPTPTGKGVACSSAQTCCITNEWNRDNPHCIDTKVDNINCGGCGLKCPTGLTCQDGLCAPPAGSIQCDGKWIDGQFNVDNCGSCGKKCKALCKEGQCVSCDKGETSCDNGYGDRRCRNLRDDSNNCGKCFHECPHGWDCRAGRCVP